MFLGSAPFLLIRQFGLTPAQTGTALLAIAGAGIAGTRLVGLTERRGDALLAGTAIALGGTLLATWLAYRGIIGPVPLVAPMMLLGVASGMIGPAAIHAAIFAEEGFAATAASLAGATQMLASGCAMAILGLFAPVTPLRLALALLLTTALRSAARFHASCRHTNNAIARTDGRYRVNGVTKHLCKGLHMRYRPTPQTILMRVRKP
jgi:DHA1 family bicyclomycin/chloramphenicol resistance-like MFS transporter